MQTIIISGHLAVDCETFQSKGDLEMVRFTVAVNSPKIGSEESKPTYYTCRMKKNGSSELLKKGRHVSVTGELRVSLNVTETKTHLNLDVRVYSLDISPGVKEN